MRRKRFINHSYIIMVCVLWGFGNPVLKNVTAHITPFSTIALRFSIAFFLLMLFAGRRVVQNIKTIPKLPCLAVSVSMALAFTLGTYALMLTKATTAGFLMGIAVLFTPFLEPLFFRTRFRVQTIPSVLIAMVGMYLLCGGDGHFTFGIGECMAILCSLSFAFLLTLSEKYIENVDPLTLSTLQCGVSALLGFAFAYLFEGGLSITLSSEVIYPLLYLSIGSTCMTCILQNTAMRNVSATFASVAFCMEPVFTAVFSYVLLGEVLSVAGFVGAAVVMVGVVVASYAK